MFIGKKGLILKHRISYGSFNCDCEEPRGRYGDHDFVTI